MILSQDAQHLPANFSRGNGRTFKLGDTVKLITGGYPLVVAEIMAGGSVRCVSAHGGLNSAVIPCCCLVSLSPQDVKQLITVRDTDKPDRTVEMPRPTIAG